MQTNTKLAAVYAYLLLLCMNVDLRPEWGLDMQEQMQSIFARKLHLQRNIRRMRGLAETTQALRHLIMQWRVHMISRL